MAKEIMVRTYSGNNQREAAELFATDAPRVAIEGWIPVAEVWVADDWPQSAYLVSVILVIFVVGIVLLLILGFIKPIRTLMVTYSRPEPTGLPPGAAT